MPVDLIPLFNFHFAEPVFFFFFFEILSLLFFILCVQVRSFFLEVEGNLMALLRACLNSEREISTCVISSFVEHFQSVETEDEGWGCGWRNIQMLCSHLLTRREGKEAMFGGLGFVPDIASLQRWLEIAWKRGFDAVGSNLLGNKVYGTDKWISTAECATLFRSFGLRARIVDFGSKEPRAEPMTSLDDVLISWIWNYFSDGEFSRLENRVTISTKSPLYFQHQGHSRTIVGIQVKQLQIDGSRQYTLLILDPDHKTEALERSLKQNSGWQRLIKRGCLCYVDQGIAHGKEREQLKTVSSIYFEA
ncbi:hypothetical protein MKW94_018920 [Papaver nudicaule]|uniref:UFSP1/2/DUB catalytic domain-containing protein n=1 Tax=Papaver nudicaule TaxID=74823 RepID=A0AA41SDJ3_PAPNU|nr:hypothetical protein [Papaver nudicaule]